MSLGVTLIDLYPDRAFYPLGQEVHLLILIQNLTDQEISLHLVVEIRYLERREALLEQAAAIAPKSKKSSKLIWNPPRRAPAGYGVDVQVVDHAGNVLAEGSTAFDVLERWTQAPRYGFLSDFGPGRADIAATLEWLTRYHINGLQFYDWMYRHEDLLTDEEPFRDPLGRLLSRQTIGALIEAAHRRNIAAMPYTAIYGASVPFYQIHSDWALRKANGEPFPFGDNFLYIMDPTPNSPWTQHLMAQFAEVLQKVNFDGIHLDQYGDPKLGYDATGQPVDLAEALPAFINLAKTTAMGIRPDAAVVFNAVNNWPIESVARADQDFVYIEVWPPHTRYHDLWEITINAQQLSGGKPVVIAAYIEPARQMNVRLANAVIFASGGYHIELGERGGMLADAYFPKYQQMPSELATVLRHYYDFAVRYENVLALGARDNTSEEAGRITIEGVNTNPTLAYKKVWIITREGERFETISLVNLLDIPDPQWNGLLLADPTPLENFKVRYETERIVDQLWLASPDFESPRAIPLNYEAGRNGAGNYVEFTIPRLEYWDLIVVEFTD